MSLYIKVSFSPVKADEQKIAREPPIPRFDSGGRFGGGPVNFNVRTEEMKTHGIGLS